MKSCRACQRTYPDEAGFCPVDGSELVSATMVPVASDEDRRVGKRLCNRYEVRRVVADGGMGRVYEGIDRETNTRVALKVLHDSVARDQVALARFKREYEISVQLPHPNIVKVLDFQHDPEFSAWLLVMEFLDGEELRVVLKREKTIPPERLVRMMAQVALGLDVAHARKFVHRDLKPDNLFLCGTRDGDVVKILDFGSVKDKNADAKKLTVMGTAIGSPYYMAPEQAQGLDTLDARADVFAMAAITYECVVGTVPFVGNNGPSILLAILTKDPVPPTQAAAGSKWPVPAKLDDVIEEGLVKNPNIRTPTVGALVDALGRAYGLDGDHAGWAGTSQSALAAGIEAGRVRASASASASPPVAFADPFASSAPKSSGGKSLDRAFEQMRAQEYESASYSEAPKSGMPGWLLVLLIAGAALLVGGGVALFFLSR